MARSVRIQAVGQLYFIRNITIQQGYLFVSSPIFNRIARGALARAARLHLVNIYAVNFLLNQFEMLIDAPELNLPEFMQCFQCELADAVNELYGRRGKVFEGRYFKADPLDDAAILERFLHITNAPIEAGLVEDLEDWAGVNSWKYAESGDPMRGTWLNHTELSRLKRKTKNKRKRFTLPKDAGIEHHTLILARLPIFDFEQMSPTEYHQTMQKHVAAHAEELREKRREKNLGYLGARKIKKLRWSQGPRSYARFKRPLGYGPAGLCLAHTHRVRQINREYAEAMRVYVENKEVAIFPLYTCRPGLIICEKPKEDGEPPQGRDDEFAFEEGR